MGKSDQHKKLVERCGEKTLDFLIGAVWEGMSQKRHPQIPLIPCKRRESVFTWVYIGSKKKNFSSIFLAILGNSKTFLFLKKKKVFFLSCHPFKNSQKLEFFRVQAKTMVFLSGKIVVKIFLF